MNEVMKTAPVYRTVMLEYDPSPAAQAVGDKARLCITEPPSFIISLVVLFSLLLFYLGPISECFHSLSCFTQTAMKAVSL